MNLEELRRAIFGAIDSLEYVEHTYPNLSGYGVRQERIVELKRVLQMLDDAIAVLASIHR